jgi:hypothetical protein
MPWETLGPQSDHVPSWGAGLLPSLRCSVDEFTLAPGCDIPNVFSIPVDNVIPVVGGLAGGLAKCGRCRRA